MRPRKWVWPFYQTSKCGLLLLSTMNFKLDQHISERALFKMNFPPNSALKSECTTTRIMRVHRTLEGESKSSFCKLLTYCNADSLPFPQEKTPQHFRRKLLYFSCDNMRQKQTHIKWFQLQFIKCFIARSVFPNECPWCLSCMGGKSHEHLLK